jgi:hypothetical protein
LINCNHEFKRRLEEAMIALLLICGDGQAEAFHHAWLHALLERPGYCFRCVKRRIAFGHKPVKPLCIHRFQCNAPRRQISSKSMLINGIVLLLTFPDGY